MKSVELMCLGFLLRIKHHLESKTAENRKKTIEKIVRFLFSANLCFLRINISEIVCATFFKNHSEPGNLDEFSGKFLSKEKDFF